jgi:hypothetical protein
MISEGAARVTTGLSKGTISNEIAKGPTEATDRATIDAIQSEINLLSPVTPGVGSCGGLPGQTFTIWFFASGASSPFDVVTTLTSGCGTVVASHDGHVANPRLFGPSLIDNVKNLMRVGWTAANVP